MKKKLTCLVLALTLCLTAMQAFAIKRGDGVSTTGTNIIPFGSFNSEDDVKKMKVNGATVSYVDTGATNKGGALKVNVTSAWGYAYVEVPCVVGETFDISFYAKIDNGSDTLEMIPMLGGGWDNSILKSSYNSQWTKYTCTYTCDGLDYQGNPNTAAIRLFNCRRGPGNVSTTYYLDELTVVPHGNVEYDWSEMSTGVSKDVIPADTGFATPQPVVEASFNDTKGHWAESTINLLAASSYVQGMGDGSYSPENNVTRAQFITMAMNILRLDGSGYKGIYKDVQSSDWYAKDIQTATDIGLIDPLMTVGGTFKPNQPITREEAASVLVKIAAMRAEKPDTQVASFADDGSITNWAKDAVYNAAEYGLIKGYPDGTFGPLKGITRAEAASMIFRLVELSSRFAVYVDGENGNDQNSGTIDEPVATIDGARKLVQPFLKNMQNHIYVFVKEGRYVLSTDVQWGVEDSGCNGFSVIYTSLGDEEPVISMGKDYSGFQLYDNDKNIYRTFIGVGTNTRQVYINGVRGVRARNEINVNGAITNPVMYEEEGYYICDDVEFADFTNQGDIELVYFEQWTNPRVRVKNIERTADGKAKINMVSESWKNGRSSGNTPTSIPVYVENAYELLDAPGEWYMNKADGYLYYMPREYEDPATMVAAVPVGERAFTIAGDSADKKVHNLKFNNLAFEYITWLWPSTAANAYRDGQANHLTGYAGDGRLTGGKEDAAVIVADAAYIDITNCTFSKLGAAGLNFRQIFQNCNVIGNHFYDISGSGMNIGVANAESDFGKYFKPTEYKNYRIYNKFNNNFIHDVSIDYLSAVGINASVGLKETEIFHNEIYNVNYSGMHVGWGWASYAGSGTGTHNLDINYNYVHDTSNSYVYDAGSVYLLGATGGSEGDYNELNYNYFENHRNSYGAAYPDEGSTWWEITGNVIDLKELKEWPRKNNAMAPRWLHIHVNTIVNNYIHDNYSTTGEYLYNSPNNKFEQAQIYEDAEWPEEAQKIMDNAGLEPQYLEVYPDSIQRLRILNEDKKYYIKSGETLNMDVVGYKRKLNEVKIPNDQLNYYSTDSKVATVDENGVIKGVGAGKCAIYVEYLDKDVIRRQYLEIVCDDVITEIVSNVSSLNVLEGYEVSLSAEGKTRFGNTVTIDEAEYSVEDSSVVSVSSDGKVKGLKKGSTVVKAVYTADGISLEKEYPVSVISYVTEETMKHVDSSLKLGTGHGFFAPNSWNHGTSVAEGGGIEVSSEQPAYYMQRIGNQLISFDMTINPEGHTWPSFAIRNARPMEDYTSSDTYMMGFKKDIIEVQRFNNGKRTMIFGDAEFSPVGGPGYPNKLENGDTMVEYGKRYSITVGALDEENGVRLVLIVNDKPIFDFVDTAEGYIKGDGLFGLYPSKTGNFVLQPYTGLKFTEEQRTGK